MAALALRVAGQEIENATVEAIVRRRVEVFAVTVKTPANPAALRAVWTWVAKVARSGLPPGRGTDTRPPPSSMRTADPAGTAKAEFITQKFESWTLRAFTTGGTGKVPSEIEPDERSWLLRRNVAGETLISLGDFIPPLLA
jgi:hypothetical protein